jgi:hypothetical protein
MIEDRQQPEQPAQPEFFSSDAVGKAISSIISPAHIGIFTANGWMRSHACKKNDNGNR